MKFVIKKILEQETEKSQNPLNKREIILFKHIQKRKKTLKTKKALIEEIKSILKYLALDEDLSLFYYEMFTLNFRPQGDYENLTYSNFKGVKDFKARKTTNVNSSQYTKAKMPFIGSNLEGQWRTDPKGVDYYVVISYGWYPVYIFKEGIWYRVTSSYSSSTGRQMGNAFPVSWDEKIGFDIIWVTRSEMDELIHGAKYEDIMKNKIEKIVKNKESLLSKRKTSAKDYHPSNTKVRFKVSDIRKEGDKAIVDVLIDDVSINQNGEFVPTNGEYLKGEDSINIKEKVESLIRNKIIHKFKDYIGKFPNWTDDGYDLNITPEKHNIRFNFIHSKEK